MAFKLSDLVFNMQFIFFFFITINDSEKNFNITDISSNLQK